MLMGVNNYSVNEIYSHSGGSANEIAALYIALMVTVGRQSGGGLAVKEACSAALPLCPHTAVMKWLHPSCWLPVKNRLIWLLSRWQMGAAASFFSPKGRGPWLSNLQPELWVSKGAATRVVRVYGYTWEDDVMQYGLSFLSDCSGHGFFCTHADDAHIESLDSWMCNTAMIMLPLVFKSILEAFHMDLNLIDKGATLSSLHAISILHVLTSGESRFIDRWPLSSW